VWTTASAGTTVTIDFDSITGSTVSVADLFGNISTLAVSNQSISVSATPSVKYIDIGTATLPSEPLLTNIAPNGTVIDYSSQQSANPAYNVISGTIDEGWTGNTSGYPHWVEVDLGSE